MTFTEALRVLRTPPPEGAPYSVKLVCGFTPLHLQTFLGAHLRQSLPQRRVTVSAGLYGNLAGSLESLGGTGNDEVDGIAVVLEWADLDPRLDFRGSGKWGIDTPADIVTVARLTLRRILKALEKVPSGTSIALSLPSLPLPPLFQGPGWRCSAPDSILQREVLDFAVETALGGKAGIVNPRRLDESSSPASRYDLKSDLSTGLPYTMPHADHLAALLVRVLTPPAPKKGIITDLDDTLWAGILGEIGPQGVQWDLASHHHLHGLYQKLLSLLSEQGVLIAVASKNDAVAVKQAFERTDLLLSLEQVFPVEAHWNAKSASVTRILRTWNISADSVIFVDDSPLELGEVAAVHPAIECIQFPKNNDPAGLKLLRQLADLCGKERVSDDDSIRLESIRQGARFREESDSGATPESFLEQLRASVTFDFETADDPRALELVNKTNQFNLNGERHTESDWHRASTQPGALTCVVSYEDRFGPLGKIAVLQGRQQDGRLSVDTWVMSCRAFARRIEYRCLKTLFEETGASEIALRFVSTSRNGPIQDFCAGILGSKPQTGFQISRKEFETQCPALYHDVTVLRERTQFV